MHTPRKTLGCVCDVNFMYKHVKYMDVGNGHLSRQREYKAIVFLVLNLPWIFFFSFWW